MMEHLEESGMAASIQSAVRAALASGGARTPDLGGAATTLAATGSVIEGLG
jgi:isocitrate/isopropylmalate dehydrogenase